MDMLFCRMNRSITKFGAVLVVTCFLFPAVPREMGNPQESKRDVRVQMRNVAYHFTAQVSVYIDRLSGEVVPIGKHEFPIFDDKESFRIRITAAKIAISTASLTNVLNSYVFARGDAPLKDISMSIENGRLKVKGRLHSKGDVSFEVAGSLSPTPDGKIRLRGEKIRALHLPVKGLMDVFGVEIADLIKSGKVPGVQAEKDDMILDLAQILPPPHIEGRVTGISLEGNNIVQSFGRPEASLPERVPATNYMAYRGNRLQFGKLLMHDTDMILIDMDPNDPFDFFLDHYKEQLSAGYTKITLQFGLRVFMKDFNKMHQHSPPQKPK